MSSTEPATQFNVFSLTLLRDRLLPSLLQDDQNEILYWAGKDLAHDIYLHGIKSIQQFFFDAGFGDLQITAQNETGQIWTLSGSIVETRINDKKSASFDLEAGFLAAQTERQIEHGAESQYQVEHNSVMFTVMTEVPATLAE